MHFKVVIALNLWTPMVLSPQSPSCPFHHLTSQWSRINEFSSLPYCM